MQKSIGETPSLSCPRRRRHRCPRTPSHSQAQAIFAEEIPVRAQAYIEREPVAFPDDSIDRAFAHLEGVFIVSAGYDRGFFVVDRQYLVVANEIDARLPEAEFPNVGIVLMWEILDGWPNAEAWAQHMVAYVRALRTTTRPVGLGTYHRVQVVTADAEFGLQEGRLIWIDEALTPDSSRFWPLDGYAPGRAQPSFDKQYVRDYLETLEWDKRPPGPSLPRDVVERSAEKYREAYRRLTGRGLG